MFAGSSIDIGAPSIGAVRAMIKGLAARQVLWLRFAAIMLLAWLCAIPTALALYPGSDLTGRMETAVGAAIAPAVIAAAMLFWKRHETAGGLKTAMIIIALASAAIFYMIS